MCVATCSVTDNKQEEKDTELATKYVNPGWGAWLHTVLPHESVFECEKPAVTIVAREISGRERRCRRSWLVRFRRARTGSGQSGSRTSPRWGTGCGEKKQRSAVSPGNRSVEQEGRTCQAMTPPSVRITADARCKALREQLFSHMRSKGESTHSSPGSSPARRSRQASTGRCSRCSRRQSSRVCR